jgi:hypothetical protein
VIRAALLIVLGATLAVACLSYAEVASAATPRERALAKQVKVLTAQNRALRAKLATCQRGAVAGVLTMTPAQVSLDLFPALYRKFEAHPDEWESPGGYVAEASWYESRYSSGRSLSYTFNLYGLDQ